MGKVLADLVLKGLVADLPTDNSAGTEGRLYAADDTDELYRDNGTAWDLVANISAGGGGAAMPQGYITGFEVDYDGTNLTVQPGVARNHDNTYDIRKTTSTTIATGSTGANALDTGTIASNTWYYVWMIAKSSDGTTAGLLSTSSSAPTLPSGYDKKRRVGAVKTKTGSATLYQQFTERAAGNRRLVMWREDVASAPFLILNGANISTSPTFDTVDCSAVVAPTSRLIFGYILQNASAASIFRWREYNITNQSWEFARLSNANTGVQFEGPVDSSQRGQIANTISATDSVYLNVNGYYENIQPAIV